MNHAPAQITLDQWDRHYEQLVAAGLQQPSYGGPLRRHVLDGDYRLLKLRFDNSPAALRLWNFLLSEESRLFRARSDGKKIIATMKDLGTVPVMVYSLPDAIAFYPDGAWWVPCIMEMSTEDLAVADAQGIDDTFCPVRAMLGAFATGEHFPKPDMLICSAGATCDDFSAIAQRLHHLQWPIHWWEIPARRSPDPDEPSIQLPGGFVAPRSQVDFVRGQLDHVRRVLMKKLDRPLGDPQLRAGIRAANEVRSILAELRQLVFTAVDCPLPALELLIAEMLAIHFCSDRDEAIHVLRELLEEVRHRVSTNVGVLPPDAVKVFWINPVADLRAMNLLEACGGRLCGTEFLFCHALDPIPEDIPPLDALAMMALADPMVGSVADRLARICRDAKAYGAEAVVISRIPGASHCPLEGKIFRERIGPALGLPVLELEVPPVCDGMMAALQNRLEALMETVRQRRHA